MTSVSLAAASYAVCCIIMLFLYFRTKLNLFLILILGAFIYALAGNIKLGYILGIFRVGFGSSLSYAGIAVVACYVIGTMMEKTGASVAIARRIMLLSTNRGAVIGMVLAGFFSSFFIIPSKAFEGLSPLAKAFANRSGKKTTTMLFALYSGIALSSMTPAAIFIIAAAGVLQLELGYTFLFGVIAAAVGAVVAVIWAYAYVNKKDDTIENNYVYETLNETYGKLPNAFLSLLPVMVPVVLVFIRMIMINLHLPDKFKPLASLAVFFGDPVIAFIFGFLLSLPLMRKSVRKDASEWMNSSVSDAALLLLYSCGAGVFASMAINSGFLGLQMKNPMVMHVFIIVPFILAAVIKAVKGCSAQAIIITVAVIAPMTHLFFNNPSYSLIAAAIGAMAVSRSNSGFMKSAMQCAGVESASAYNIFGKGTAVCAVLAFITLEALTFIK